MQETRKNSEGVGSSVNPSFVEIEIPDNYLLFISLQWWIYLAQLTFGRYGI